MARFRRLAVRAAFVVAVLLTLHDIAGIQSPNAPFEYDKLSYRLLAAASAGLLAVAGSLIASNKPDRSATALALALIGFALGNDWFSYALSDPLFWVAVTLSCVGSGLAMGALLYFVLTETRVHARPGERTAVASIVGVAFTFMALAFPVLLFGESSWPRAARRADDLLSVCAVVTCAVMIYLCGRALLRRREDTAAGTITALIGLIAFGLGTAIHAVVRLALTGAEPFWAIAIDTIGQFTLAAMLAVSIFRHHRFEAVSALSRQARWTLFGGLVAIVLPVCEIYLHERLKEHLDTYEAFGGEQNSRLFVTVSVGLTFAGLDRRFERWLEKKRAPSGGDETAAVPPG